MTVYQLLTSLPDATRRGLYRAGMLTIAAYTKIDVYERYLALLALPRYADAPTEAVREIVRELRVSRRTVYRAIREMQREV